MTPPYNRARLPADPSVEDLESVFQDYESMAFTVMAAITDRFDRNDDYPFVDTKLDLITGLDFDAEDPVRGRNAVYGWIQGRGIEALAGHADWLREAGHSQPLRQRIEQMLRAVLDQVRRIRDRNNGRLSFFMFPDGTPFTLAEDGTPEPVTSDADRHYGFSDLFTAKGLYAAGLYLEDEQSLSEARDYIAAVEDAIWSRTFVSDQISLDPKNPVESRVGCHAHGPTMIHIGAAALLAEAGESGAVERGLRLIEHEMTHYTNLDGGFAEFESGDFWEGIDDSGQPYRDEGRVLSDPGHALECVGLAGRFLGACSPPADDGLARKHERATSALHTLLARNFDNGHLDPPGGIVKAFDLVSRQALNTDLPWWNLPETVRAAAWCLYFAQSEEQRATACRIFAACHNAFTANFVRPDLHLMAYQTIDAQGKPVSVIPATADADPGYHTGLSLLDAIRALRRLEC